VLILIRLSSKDWEEPKLSNIMPSVSKRSRQVDLKEYRPNMTDPRRLFFRIGSLIKRGGFALAGYVVAMVIVGGYMLIKFPLETLIVAIFIGSVFLLNRG
jgi:hypothetical protein